MTQHRFWAAVDGEPTVFGAHRPGYHSDSPSPKDVDDWIAAMQGRNIDRVCCLLEDTLEDYDDLLGRYRSAFGNAAVLHAPISDHSFVDHETLHEEILPFLREADEAGERVVVHCSAGLGRTGHVLALWRAIERTQPLNEALVAVAGTGTGRLPLEADDKTPSAPSDPDNLSPPSKLEKLV